VVFLWMAIELWRKPAQTSPMRLFTYSLIYLAIIFVAMGVDSMLLS